MRRYIKHDQIQTNNMHAFQRLSKQEKTTFCSLLRVTPVNGLYIQLHA